MKIKYILYISLLSVFLGALFLMLPTLSYAEDHSANTETSLKNLMDTLNPKVSSDCNSNSKNKKCESKPSTSNEGIESHKVEDQKRIYSSELKSIKDSIAPCWVVNPKEKANIRIDLEVYLKTDMSIRDAKIIDQEKYNSDAIFHKAADQARGALLNPKCSKLPLSPQKYKDWKVFNYSFELNPVL